MTPGPDQRAAPAARVAKRIVWFPRPPRARPIVTRDKALPCGVDRGERRAAVARKAVERSPGNGPRSPPATCWAARITLLPRSSRPTPRSRTRHRRSRSRVGGDRVARARKRRRGGPRRRGESRNRKGQREPTGEHTERMTPSTVVSVVPGSRRARGQVGRHTVRSDRRHPDCRALRDPPGGRSRRNGRRVSRAADRPRPQRRAQGAARVPRGRPAFAARFLRESRIAGSLSHPNIVTVHDYFEHDGMPYIAMEYVERGSLRPLRRAADAARRSPACSRACSPALAHAESHGIVHRDLKPENLMVTRRRAASRSPTSASPRRSTRMLDRRS